MHVARYMLWMLVLTCGGRGTVMLGRMLAATAIIALAPAGRHDAGPSTIADASITTQEPAAPEAALNGSMRRGEGGKLQLAQAPVNPDDVAVPATRAGLESILTIRVVLARLPTHPSRSTLVYLSRHRATG